MIFHSQVISLASFSREFQEGVKTLECQRDSYKSKSLVLCSFPQTPLAGWRVAD